MKIPIRIQRKRIKGWRMPENTVSVTRPGKWGNPFKVGCYLNAWGKAFVALKVSGNDVINIRNIYKTRKLEEKITLEQSLQWYRLLLADLIDSGKLNPNELSGKNLACFCSLDQKCHADILLEIANKILVK